MAKSKARLYIITKATIFSKLKAKVQHYISKSIPIFSDFWKKLKAKFPQYNSKHLTIFWDFRKMLMSKVPDYKRKQLVIFLDFFTGILQQTWKKTLKKQRPSGLVIFWLNKFLKHLNKLLKFER